MTCNYKIYKALLKNVLRLEGYLLPKGFAVRNQNTLKGVSTNIEGGLMTSMETKLLTVVEVAKMLSISISGVWAKAKNQAGFPQPFKLSAKQTRWLHSELVEFIKMLMGTREAITT